VVQVLEAAQLSLERGGQPIELDSLNQVSVSTP
jgi:hypothetical protein